MPKFKVGDRVKITNVDKKHAWIKPLEGEEGTVKKVFKCANPDVGCYDIGLDYIISENELEIIKPIKPKFNIDDCTGNWAMHVNTEEEAKIYLTYLHNAGKRWVSGSSLLGNTLFDVYCTRTCYSTCYPGNDGMVDYGTTSNAYLNYTILEFDDFDWSDFEMKKEFTKEDLKNGDIIKFRGGAIGVAIPEINSVLFKEAQTDLQLLTEDMRHSRTGRYDVMAVRRPTNYEGCSFYAFESFHKNDTELVYERKEVEEMTLEEVCKALGKEIKIVKK